MTDKPDLTRVWAETAPGGNIEDPDVTSPGKYTAGWLAEVPTFQNFNYLQQQFSQGLAHANENGIMVWDTNTSYPFGGIVKGSDDKLYIASVANSGNDPVGDGGPNWSPFAFKLTFNNVAEMVASIYLPVGISVTTLGYYSAGDGGGSEYVIVSGGTGTDDGGSYIDLDNSNQAELIVYDTVNIKQFGATGDGVTDDTTALNNIIAFTQTSDIFYPPGQYVATNFPKLTNQNHIGDKAFWRVNSINIPIPTTGGETSGDATFYVSTTGSDSLNCGMDATVPFLTIQHAIDQLPANVIHRITIEVAAGTYNQSNRPASSMPRPAIVFPNRKYITRRTAQDGSELEGFILIAGSGKATTFIQTTNDYIYGIYVSGTELAVQDVTIQSGSALTESLVVGHRAGYVHIRNCDVDGNSNGNIGMSAEAGGTIEAITCEVYDSSTDLVPLFDSLISFASNSIAGSSSITGVLSLAVGSELTGSTIITGQGILDCTGTSPNRCTVSGNITASSGVVNGVFTDFTATLICRAGSVRLNTCGFSETIAMDAGNLRLEDSQSYVAPATMSNVAIPITATNDSAISRDALTILRDSGNNLISQDYGRMLIQPNADAFVIPITLTGSASVMQINASGANRFNCTLGVVQNVFAGTPPPDGAVLHLVGSGFNTEIVNGATATIPGGTITIGSITAANTYTGLTFTYSTTNASWMLSGVGALA